MADEAKVTEARVNSTRKQEAVAGDDQAAEGPQPKLVSGPAFDRARLEADADDKYKDVPSANPVMAVPVGIADSWADQGLDPETAAPAEQKKAFDLYQERPDIETRAEILARDNAFPGEFVRVQENADEKVKDAAGEQARKAVKRFER